MTRDELEFLTEAMAADGGTREALWRGSLADKRTTPARLRTALLQSLPGHAGYDPAAAESAMRSLLERDPDSELAAVARLRLVELKTELKPARECREEVATLKRRLSQVVDIERRMNSNGK